jgi:peptidoglycan/xylan/chitin deacetylase (PgdA/CDA1 family)
MSGYMDIRDTNRSSAGGVLVLCYHRIVPERDLVSLLFGRHDDAAYTVSLDAFRRQIEELRDRGYSFITPTDLAEYVKGEKPLNGKSALITFDDGDESLYRYAYPYLKQQQIPFTSFFITGQVGNPNYRGLKMMTWEQIREMKESGLLTVGLHTHNLHYVDSEGRPPFLRKDHVSMFIEDLKLSIRTIREELGVTADCFAYPYGFGIPETDEAAMKMNVSLLFTLKPGVVKSGDPRFMIRRNLVTEESFAEILDRYE